MKKILIIAAILLLVAGGWFFLGKSPLADTTKPAMDKLVVLAEKRDIEFNIDVSGEITPAFQLDVKPEVGGKVKALHVAAGQTVKSGELLAEIDDTDLLTERASATTEIEGAQLVVDKNRRNFERAKDLFAGKLINKETFENLSADYEIAQNDFRKAERRLQSVDDRLRKTKILAPADGTVLSVGVIQGQVVTAAASVNSGTSLMTIANLSSLLIDTQVNQVDVTKLALNQPVQLTSESLKDLRGEAKISFIAPIATLKNNLKGFQVQALVENPDPRLRPGMAVNISVPIANAQAAVSVPLSAVFKSDTGAKVVYVRHGEESERREVKIGITNLDFAEIKSGIAPGEEILLAEPRPAQKRS